MIAVCVVPYVWLRYLYYTDDVYALHLVENEFGLRPRDVTRAWRAFPHVDLITLWTRGLTPFLTYMFLHAGPVHLLANMLCLFVLGSRLERDSSSLRFLLFYLGVGVLAGVAQCLFPSNPAHVMLGSSGAVAGVIGAYLLQAWRARILVLLAPLPLFVEVPVLVLAVAWILLQLRAIREFLKMGEGQPLTHMAHLAGFLAGLLLWWLLRRRRATGSGTRRTGTVE